MDHVNRRDRALLIAAKNGDLSAFEDLVRLYERKLLWVVGRIIVDPHAAEEVVQDVFVSIYQAIEHIDETRPFAPYLYTVAKNASISFFRRKLYGKETPLDDVHASIVNIEKEYIDTEERQRVQRALKKLPLKYQTPIRLYYFDDVSYEKIAHMLDIPVNTVRTHLKRAKKLLAELL
ncbi:MAG: sigma-70 family RNA polymerase sigma factor [Patescibacteria group bacterium]